jgi:TorA maturation chaperone TorD
MTSQDKGFFCQVLASLFYPPNQELAGQISRGTLLSYFEANRSYWGGPPESIEGLVIKENEGNSEVFLKELKEEYDRLYSELSGETASLVESFYKPWTRDPSCSLSFASQRGLLMGDSALHLLYLYDQCGLNVSEEFSACPDHIGMELEFLATLFDRTTDMEIKRFIGDHLDWVPLLKERLRPLSPQPFYKSVIEVADLFLDTEKKRLEVDHHE